MSKNTYEGYTDWKGRPISEDQKAGLDRLPKCRYCGDPVNTPSREPRPNQQTESEIRELAGHATHVLSHGGPVSIDCFIEHHKPFMNYVWYERVDDRLIERPYSDDETRGGEVYGVWPLVFPEAA